MDVDQLSLPIIKRIASLKKLGVFRNFAAPADLPDFQRHNLIYGFNGSGKTILSRVFASLGEGAMRPELPERGTFEVELAGETVIKSTGALDALKGRVLVFNVDFIEENLRWKEGTANPVFYLGKAQAELAKKLEEADTVMTALTLRREEVAREYAQKERAFTDHKRDAARLIAEQLSLGRRYDASDLTADHAKGSYDEKLKLSEAERQNLRAIITQDAPLAKRDPLDSEPFGLAGQIREVRKILDTTLGTLALVDLREHEMMLKWVKEGVDYHQEHGLSSCLFCGNELTEERMLALGQAIDERFDRLTDDIADGKKKTERLRDRLAALKRAIPSDNDISKELLNRFAPSANDLQASLARGAEIVGTMLALLAKKAAAPNVRADAGNLATEADAAEWDTAAAERVSNLSAIIEAHNASHDKFGQVQEAASTKLKEHVLADGQARYRELEADAAAAKTELDRLEAKQVSFEREAERLKQKMRQHGPAADVINQLIRGYLGHKELEVGTQDRGYQIFRNGKPVTGSLSEGEKTAIALCYFLSMLEAEGRQPKNLIVVVDDPISSLDTKALHYAFGIIRSALEGTGQLIIMTHNLHFMNEVKKWLRTRARKEKPTATLLFLDAVQHTETDTRSSSIKVMPKLIREYDSEYQYLFHLVLEFTRSQDGQTGYFYVMPNALRKVLEIFLAFKLPGSEGLSNKMDNVANGGYDLDPARVRALDRLVQLESHADNLDDLVTFSSMAIEETKDAADALLALMIALDEGHFDRLCRICG